MASSFENSFLEFQEFLQKNDYPQNIAWVRPRDVLLTGRRLILVRASVPRINQDHVRQLFDLSQSNRTGILFETICAVNDTTYAYAWVPKDETERKRRLMVDGVKMSAKTGLGRVPGKAIRSRLCWKYLEWSLRKKQQNKDLLFS